VFLTRSLQRRLLFFGGILTFFPLAIIFLVVLNANERIGSAAQEESRKLAFADLDHIAQGVVQLMDGLYEQGGESETPSAEQLGILREHVQSFIVGQTGYVFVLDRAGNYVSSFQGKRDGENILDAKDASGRLFIRSMLAKAEKLQPGEMAEEFYPWQNQGDPAPRTKVARIRSFAPWNLVVGAGSYLDEFEAAEQRVAEIAATSRLLIGAVALFSLLAAIAVWWSVSRRISNRMGEAAARLRDGSAQVHCASREIAKASGQLSSAASQQAAALQETSASLVEISSAVESTAASSQKADEGSKSNLSASEAAQSGAKSAVERTERSQLALAELTEAVEEIRKSSEETAKIIGTIDEIAFQTNLLALNAAVEAARAGDAGRGFAVVAEEVRALATRSAEAAQGTAELLDAARTHAQAGTDRVHEVSGALNQVAEEVRQVSSRISEVTQTSEEQTAVTAEVHRASEEQSSGIAQIQKVVTDLDRETQGTAALAEETAASSEELDKQAGLMTDVVEELELIVHGPRRA
jgi:methyl-accepting chemotaxis protein